MTRRRWFDRRFAQGLPPEALPDIVERLRGTPARLEERTAGLSRDQLVRRPREAWSIQENAGHLLDLEPLWSGRLDELLAGAAVLRAADLENRRTFEANHHARALADILAEFRRTRLAIVDRWVAVVRKSGLTKHGDVVTLLKAERRMVQGPAHRSRPDGFTGLACQRPPTRPSSPTSRRRTARRCSRAGCPSRQ